MPKTKLTSTKVESLLSKLPQKGQVDHFDSTLPGFGLRLGRNGGAWFCFYRIDGKLIRDTIGASGRYPLAEARELARERLRLVERGIDPRREAERQAALEAAQRRETFGAVADEYRRSHLSKRKSGAQSERYLSDFVAEWKALPVRELTRREILRVLDIVEAKRGPISRNRAVSLIKHICNWAIDRELIEHNPAQRVKMLDERRRERILSDAELVEVWKASDLLEAPRSQAVKMLILSAQRRNEIMLLETAELDRAQMILKIRAARMKHGKPHVLPLTDMMLGILDAIPDELKGGTFVFQSPGRPGAPIGGSSRLKDDLDRHILAARRAENPNAQPPEHWCLHDLRRTARSGLSRLRVPREVSELVLSHLPSDLVQTYDLFDFLDPMRDGLERWGKHVAALVSPTPSNVVPLRQATS